MSEQPLQPQSPSELLAAIRARTPARILAGRSGGSYRTETQLSLRLDHAAARDAVQTEIELPAEWIERYRLFEVQTRATNKPQYLMRPDLGRQLNDEARRLIVKQCPAGKTLQVAIGDGLSAAAVKAQVPGLLPLIQAESQHRNWSWGRPFLVRYCRVGVLNDIGELLRPQAVVLLIGERPGLATAESLSAYLAFQPRAGHTDAQRNLISNIHARGVSVEEAAFRIAELAGQMLVRQTSGVAIKEQLPDASGGMLPTAPR